MTTQVKPTIEIIPLINKVKIGQSSEMDFLIRITAPKSQSVSERPILNLGLVLDRSGSMSGDKIKKAKEATLYCLDQMLDTDRFSLTIFDHRIDVVVPSDHPNNRSEIKSKIQKIESEGSTALHAAWAQGGKQVAEHMDSKMLNRILLITDGLANEGETDTDVIVSHAKNLYKRGISTTTIGIGNDFNEELLVPMAQESGGNNWFVETANDFKRIFESEMEGLVRERFINVFMSISPEKGVDILDVMNDFNITNKKKYKLPNLIDEEPLNIIIKTKLPPKGKGKHTLFSVKFEWYLLGTKKKASLNETAAIEYASKKDVDKETECFQVQKEIQLLEAARIKKQAIDYLDMGDYEASTEILQSMAPIMNSLAAEHNDADLAEEAAYMNTMSDKLQYESERTYSRKSLRYASVNQQRGKKVKK